MLVMVAGSAIVGFLYLVSRLFSSISFAPDSRAWKSLLAALRHRIDTQKTRLVAWESDMTGLLSLNRLELKKPGFFNTVYSGVYTTIYQEPVLAYAGQRSGNTSVLVARTSNREFVFRNKGKETEVWVNSQPFALFSNGALLSAGRSSQQLARLEAQPDESQFPIMIGQRTAAAVANPGRAAGPNPRAFTLLRELNQEEETAVLALAIMQLNEQLR